MDKKDNQVVDLFEGAMSLYNTINVETNKVENEYKDAETEIKKVLGDEEPLFVPDDDAVSGMLFQYLNLGYAVCGLKYLDMLFNNKSIAGTAVGYALQVLNANTEELIKYKELYGDLPSEDGEKPIEEKELQGISKN